MNILMFTNTFTPHLGGVARSVGQFAAAYRRKGHSVLVVAPEYAGHPTRESGIIRIPAIQNFNGSDFSVAVPIPGYLHQVVEEFHPDIAHAHHPFILGDTALRVSARHSIPVVFTHHTQYEQYTHYVPGDCEMMKRFVIDLAVGYCNLCDAVIAPSKTIQERLISQGVNTTLAEIPTGVDLELFRSGNGAGFRRANSIPPDAVVVGHVGRLAPEKGLDFLSDAVAEFVSQHGCARFIVAGAGPCESAIRNAFACRNVAHRLVMCGPVERNRLPSLYSAMDVFAFASQTETQGMVLTEAMAAGTPVVAVDAAGVREVVKSDYNGFKIAESDTAAFIQALQRFVVADPTCTKRLAEGARETAAACSMDRTAADALALYQRCITRGAKAGESHDALSVARQRVAQEWNIWSNVAEAFAHAVT